MLREGITKTLNPIWFDDDFLDDTFTNITVDGMPSNDIFTLATDFP